jgi:arabinan endo-1,5-alpha-L-arabinosidase
MAFATDTLMAHDPVMAYEQGTYYLLSTGMGIQWATSKDRKTWVVQPTPFIEKLPQWAYDSVPGFRGHVWAPDIIRWHDRWWLTYSCSTFGKNTSAIGLMSADRLNGEWRDEGCLVRSEAKRDNWNAIDSNIAIDDNDQPWLVWGSFWDGILLCEASLLNNKEKIKNGCAKTIARRINLKDSLKAAPNPTSKFAGRNAIEAPFIFKKHGWYYLFVSWDYCCRGSKSNYRVMVGRSKNISGPYLDREGNDMAAGGGTLFFEGDKQQYEAAGHCAAYTLPTPDGGEEDLFICHGYSATRDGMALLIQRPIRWTADGWPTL